MKIYLASPFFNEEELKIYNEVIDLLRSEGDLSVFVPREHTIPNAWDLPNHIWGENVFAVDYLAITKCDVVVVLNFGMYSDSGTAWECGCAFALGKKVVNVLCGTENEEY
jgi:nucleoside 2-deoxyribosyltransferase